MKSRARVRISCTKRRFVQSHMRRAEQRGSANAAATRDRALHYTLVRIG